MNESAISQYITGAFDSVHVVDAWGDTFFYYNPSHELPDEIYFATLKSNDDEYDNVSNLNRPETFRLNIGITKPTFRTLFGAATSRRATADGVAAAYDFGALDQLLPHPVYGHLFWVCVLNPSDATFQTVVQPLLTEAFELAVAKFGKRATRGRRPKAPPSS